jgi:hypothetical protein
MEALLAALRPESGARESLGRIIVWPVDYVGDKRVVRYDVGWKDDERDHQVRNEEPGRC